MSTFLSESLPEQPAFLYSTYAPTATVTASTSAAGYSASDILQADENNGWKPLNTSPTTLTIDLGSAITTDHIALVGTSLSGVLVSLAGADNAGMTGSVVLVAETAIASNGESWLKYATASHRYLQVTVSAHSTAFQIKHMVVGLLAPLPFMEDGFCPNPIQAEGQHLVSYAGLFLGSVTQRVIRPFTIPFGQVDAVEEVAFSNWKAACVETSQGFFFVPDTASATCYFGYVDKKWKYEPVMKMGMATIPKIPFTARVR